MLANNGALPMGWRESVKKFLNRIMVLWIWLMLPALTACSQTPQKPEMYIEKAELTRQEENLAKLLGANENQRIYDFKLDDTVQTVRVNTYELKDGSWQLISGGGGQQFSDSRGRMALRFDKLSEGMRVAIQSEDEYSAVAHSTEPAEEIEGMSRTTSALEDLAEIEYEQEIPLAIQICTTKDSVYSYQVEYFFSPEEYEKHDYEEVYAVTVLFSQKTIGELE